MTSRSIEKVKLLLVLQMLLEETDAEHGLSMTAIMERLEEEGIRAGRKSIYSDVDAIRELGYDVQIFHRAPAEYAIVNRDFSIGELSLLVDAVQSSRFLSQRKSDQLVAKIKSLGSIHEQKLLHKPLAVEGRIHSQSESALLNVDVIQQAMREKKQLRFRYNDYNRELKRIPRKGGEAYEETPVKLIYSDGNYYLMAYNADHDSIVTYRVDRMSRVCVINRPAVRNKRIATFDATQFTNRAFNMYSGEAISVKLRVDDALLNQFVDRFGLDLHVAPVNESQVHITVHVLDSPTFYGWLAQFGSAVRIESPASVVTSFSEHLRKIQGLYE